MAEPTVTLKPEFMDQVQAELANVARRLPGDPVCTGMEAFTYLNANFAGQPPCDEFGFTSTQMTEIWKIHREKCMEYFKTLITYYMKNGHSGESALAKAKACLLGNVEDKSHAKMFFVHETVEKASEDCRVLMIQSGAIQVSAPAQPGFIGNNNHHHPHGGMQNLNPTITNYHGVPAFQQQGTNPNPGQPVGFQPHHVSMQTTAFNS